VIFALELLNARKLMFGFLLRWLNGMMRQQQQQRMIVMTRFQSPRVHEVLSLVARTRNGKRGLVLAWHTPKAPET
jgi:hypothetical protein